MKWLSGLIGGWAPWAKYLAVAVACAALYGGGYRNGVKVTKGAAAQAALVAERQKVRELRAQEAKNDALALELQVARGLAAPVFFTIRAEIPRVSDPIIVTEPVTGTPVFTVSRGFVRVWNDALNADLQATARRVPGTTPANDATADEKRSSGIGLSDILDNHVVNAEADHLNRLQCQRLINWHRAYD